MEEWNQYTLTLHLVPTRITYHEDEMVWDYDQSREYTPKAGYIMLKTKQNNRDTKWWSIQLSKLKCPSMSKLLTWSILEHTDLTWDIFPKR